MEIADQIAYDPETGVFTWKIDKSNFIKEGSVAGTITKKGYRHIAIDGRRYYAQVLAVYLMTGKWPEHQVDHKNLVKDDNRWSNLREATVSDNGANKVIYKNNTTGYKGVSFSHGKFQAKTSKDGKKRHIGTYWTAEEAAKAYDVFVLGLHGEFANLNFDRSNYVY